jgi:uncharacterized membrane protein YcaP (DUF421 family)
MQQQLTPFDLHRIFIGQNPGWFMLEVLLRIALIYVVLMIAMRLMGKRVASQMSVSELGVIVTLGAAVGVPMQVPDRGMLPAILILIVAIFFQRGVSLWGFRNRKVEMIAQGDVSVLVQDGRIFLDAMRTAVFSRERLFALLRSRSIEHLGQVRRVYLETSGDVSIFQLAKPKPGLSIIPLFDADLRKDCKTVPGIFACYSCGNMREAQAKPTSECQFCGSEEWTPAVKQVAVLAEEQKHRERQGGDGADGDHQPRDGARRGDGADGNSRRF